ncbi:MAG TPA: hypothetical protein VFG76_08195 [Candidatus Polarisedimenticolia bacterium]|nr:hypothetical protein [Candidatus Polarisedimenticolia bacterium]
MKITVLETLTFVANEFPYNVFGSWGCAFSSCPMGQRVVPGQRVHKIEVDKDVDLIHLNCFVDMKKELLKLAIPFTVEDKTSGS